MTTETLAPSPYRPIFAEIERVAQLYPYEGYPYMPSMAYRDYYDTLQRADLDPAVYVSMAITSGGFARDESLDVGQVVQQNNTFGEHVRDMLQETAGFDASLLLVPSELGKVNEWSQADYLMFWFHTLAGIRPDAAHDIEKQMMAREVYSPGRYAPTRMNKSQGDERGAAYREFTEVYVGELMRVVRSQSTLYNMRAVLGLLDPARSLGATAERVFAHTVGIPYYGVFSAEALLKESLQQQVSRLTQLGATSVGLVESGFQFSGVLGQHSTLPLRRTGLATARDIFDIKQHAPRHRRPD